MSAIKNKHFTFLFILFFFWIKNVYSQPENNSRTPLNLLSEAYPAGELSRLLVPPEAWRPYPAYQDRAAWENLPEEIKESYITAAEEALDYQWSPLPATLFLEFSVNGNRSNYQAVRSKRRKALLDFVLAECMEGKGRFTEQIVNGIWAICEESYWGVPAHMYLQEAGVGLPDVEEPTVDLFAAETSALLSWTDYLMNEALDEVSPLIRKRIYHEADRRILTPNQMRDDFWWMGFDRGRHVNNWNPWINSNWLTTTLLLEKDPKRRTSMVHKSLRSLDNFLNPYPQDGGCDEGPSYWGRAAGSTFDCLEILHKASDEKIDVFDEALIQNMGKYIYRVHIDDDYFVNYADATARVHPEGFLVYRYGKHIQDQKMMAFGASFVQNNDSDDNILVNDRSLGRHLGAIFSYKDVMQQKPALPYLKDVWLPDVQVMVARTQGGSPDNFFVSAKGGHNNESHNHNDVGNFIIYVDGQPAIMDVGVEEYTAKTFSSNRYDIWTMQSAYHNLPTINGIMQKNGRSYAARNVQYEADDTSASFSLDLAEAYPKEAQVKKWQRTIHFDRKKSAEIRDEYELNSLTGSMTQTLMTAFSAKTVEPGRIKLSSRSASKPAEVFVSFDNNQFEVNIEEIPITDPRLQQAWDAPLTRMLFTAKIPKQKDKWKFIITQNDTSPAQGH